VANLGLDVTKTAVLAMDFQEGIVSNFIVREPGVLQRAKLVLEGARRSGLLVIHVVIQFREGYPEVSSRNKMLASIKKTGRFVIGGKDTSIYKELSPRQGEVIVSRSRANAFYNTDLQSILSSRGINTLVLMGIATNWVVESAARYAADADYRVIVLEDCCAGITQAAHSFSVSNILKAIGEVSNSHEFLESV
jgi:nicotinamidase-related amidase